MKPNNQDQIGAYYKGLRDGITLFAWWKDGTQYVGTCGKTLKEALKEVDLEIESLPPDKRPED